jgi:hypothetical protein
VHPRETCDLIFIHPSLHTQSHALSFFSQRPDKRQKLGRATTTGATLRGDLKLFKYETLRSTQSMVVRRPLTNLSNINTNNNSMMMGSPSAAVKRMTPQRDQTRLQTKTPSVADFRRQQQQPETPKSSLLSRKTPVAARATGGVGALLRQKLLPSTPKRLFGNATAKERAAAADKGGEEAAAENLSTTPAGKKAAAGTLQPPPLTSDQICMRKIGSA